MIMLIFNSSCIQDLQICSPAGGRSGTDWVGRTIRQHKFCKAGEVPDDSEAVEITEGHVENGDEEETGSDGRGR